MKGETLDRAREASFNFITESETFCKIDKSIVLLLYMDPLWRNEFISGFRRAGGHGDLPTPAGIKRFISIEEWSGHERDWFIYWSEDLFKCFSLSTSYQIHSFLGLVLFFLAI